MAVNCIGDAETTARVSLLQTPPSFGKRLERNQDVSEGEPLELKAKVNGSPKPIVSVTYENTSLKDVLNSVVNC